MSFIYDFLLQLLLFLRAVRIYDFMHWNKQSFYVSGNIYTFKVSQGSKNICHVAHIIMPEVEIHTVRLPYSLITDKFMEIR